MCNLAQVAAVAVAVLLALCAGYSIIGAYLSARDGRRAVAFVVGVAAGFLFGAFAELIQC